jgi:hypothetical protein
MRESHGELPTNARLRSEKYNCQESDYDSKQSRRLSRDGVETEGKDSQDVFDVSKHGWGGVTEMFF